MACYDFTQFGQAREKCEDEAIIEVSTTEELEAVQALSSETQMWLEDYGYVFLWCD